MLKWMNIGSGVSINQTDKIMNPKIATFLDSKGCYARKNPKDVDQALARLGVTPSESFIEFYRRFEGGFGSPYTGIELADIVGHAEELTSSCRTVHKFPPNLIVISEPCGDAILVYATNSDSVHDVDFEGSDELIKKGELKPDWHSFEEFLEWYFLGGKK